MKQLMQEVHVNTDVRHAVDLGCSTGLSTLELHHAFPEAQITAVDLSPYFITVAKHDQRHRQVTRRASTSLIATKHCISCKVLMFVASLADFKLGSKPQSWLQFGWLSADRLVHQVDSLQANLVIELIYASLAVCDVSAGETCTYVLCQYHLVNLLAA